MEEVPLKWKPTQNRLLRENTGSGTKTYTQKIEIIHSVSRDFKPFIAPAGSQLLMKMRNPDAKGNKKKSGIGMQYRSTGSKFWDL